MAEFELIERIRRRVHPRGDVLLGIGDDAAVLQVPPGRDLVVAMDTLNAGVHFPPGTAAADIGWKALAVNLSDLAAMGAEPAWCTLSLSLPDADLAWIDGFLDGFAALAARHRVALVGGDTTRGPLSVSLTVHGFVPHGQVLRRSGARPGDDLWVTGTLGDAAGALALLADGSEASAPARRVEPAQLAWLRARLDRPEPRVEFARDVARFAHAAIDVSDGLLADLGHLCAASGLGAQLELAALPASEALRGCFAREEREHLQAGGGDDYELCLAVPSAQGPALLAASARHGVAVACIGRAVEGEGVRVADERGRPWSPERAGYVHFG